MLTTFAANRTGWQEGTTGCVAWEQAAHTPNTVSRLSHSRTPCPRPETPCAVLGHLTLFALCRRCTIAAALKLTSFFRCFTSGLASAAKSHCTAGTCACKNSGGASGYDMSHKPHLNTSTSTGTLHYSVATLHDIVVTKTE
jgi:hypothetical protein